MKRALFKRINNCTNGEPVPAVIESYHLRGIKGKKHSQDVLWESKPWKTVDVPKMLKTAFNCIFRNLLLSLTVIVIMAKLGFALAAR